MGSRLCRAVVVLLLLPFTGCCHPFEITAISLSNPEEPCGLPFYLPKPLLIVAKNFRNVEERTDGLTDPVPIPSTFDAQQGYADLKANVTTNPAPASASPADKGTAKKQAGPVRAPDGTLVPDRMLPGEAPKDGATPDTFYTYQIVFVPDLTQKYALQVKGGPGEVRAALNLVNGWMFTGLGPFYLKDSSTAQNIMAGGAAVTLAGRGVADVASSLADLRRAGIRQAGQVQGSQVVKVVQTISTMMDRNGLAPAPICLPRYAEIHIYEPVLTPERTVEWRRVVSHEFDRAILGLVNRVETTIAPPGDQPSQPKLPKVKETNPENKNNASDTSTPTQATTAQATLIETTADRAAAERVARLLGGSPLPGTGRAVRQAGPVGAAPAASAAPGAAGNNITVNVNPPCRGLGCLWPFRCCAPTKKPTQVQETYVLEAETLATQSPATNTTTRGIISESPGRTVETK